MTCQMWYYYLRRGNRAPLTGDLMMTRYLSCAETAKLVRAALKAAFPAVKFSVKSHTYSMGASINVSWTDGPTDQRVRDIVRQFEGADFDGMQDMQIQRPPMNLDGESVHSGADYIHCRREMSDKHWTQVAATVAKYYGVEMPTREQSTNMRVPQAGEYFSTLVYRATHDRTRYAGK